MKEQNFLFYVSGCKSTRKIKKPCGNLQGSPVNVGNTQETHTHIKLV